MIKQNDHIQRRDGRYYLRCRIPIELVHILGKTEYKKSLRTTCSNLAKIRAGELYANLCHALGKVRGMGLSVDQLKKEFVKVLETTERVHQAELEVDQVAFDLLGSFRSL